MPPATPPIVWHLVLLDGGDEDGHRSFRLQDNDRVYVKSTGRRGSLVKSVKEGRLSEIPAAKRRKTSTGEELWNVRYNDDDGDAAGCSTPSSGSDVMMNRRHLIPIYRERRDPQTSNGDSTQQQQPAAIPIIVTPDTDSFRLLAASQVRSAHVLEIGSSTGETSHQLWKVPCVESWMGWDTGADMVQQVQKKIKQGRKRGGVSDTRQSRTCHKIDPLKDPDTAAALVMETFAFSSQQQQQRSLTVFVDIGGDRQLHAVILMLQWIVASFATRIDQAVVKSRTLFAALQAETAKDGGSSPLLFDHNSWFPGQLRTALRASMPSHPLQAAKRFVPADSNKEEGEAVAICRYHNYHADGCAKHRDLICPYDHSRCHLCLQKGHIARDCDWIR